MRASVFAPFVVLSLIGGALAQTAPAPGAAAPATPAAPAPATPAPAAPAPATPAPADATPAPATPLEPAFGEAVELPQRPALILEGNSSWDEFFPSSRAALDQLTRTAKAQGLMPAGAPMVRVSTANDDTVLFTAVQPVLQQPNAAMPIAPVTAGQAPSGPHLKFTHLGAYDTIEQTYDEVANYLDEKGLVAEDYFVEEYPMDPNTTPETEMMTNIYVRLKK